MGAPPEEMASAADWAPSLGAQAVWLLVAKTVGFAFAVALPLVLVRRLSLEEFGLYKQVFLVVMTAATVLPLGLGMSAFYYLPRERRRQGAVITNILVFHAATGLAVAAVLWAFPQLLARVFNNPAITAHSGLIGTVVVLWTVGSFLEIAPVALQDVRASTALIISSQFSKTALLLVAAVAVGTVRSLLIAALFQGLAQLALMTGYLHRRFPHFWRGFDLDLLWKQVAYALPLGGSGLLLRLQNDVHHAFVSNAFGPAAYAVYAVGVFKLPLLGLLRESIGSVVLPRINELESRNQRRQILELVAVAARKLALVYFPVYGILMVTGRELIEVLFTRQYIDSWPIFAVAMSFWPFGIIVMDPVTRAHGERFFFLALRLGTCVAVVLVLWQYAATLGLLGVIATVIVAAIAGWCVTAVRMARLLQADRRDLTLFRDVGRIAIVTSIAALAAVGVRWLVSPAAPWRMLLLCGSLFALVYVAGIVQWRVLRKDEVVRLLREVTRSVFGARAWKASGQSGSTAPAAEGAVRSGP
jgi:O-antigen/teichoic acid export membrane protein